MRKIPIVICLIITFVITSSGFADQKSFKEFLSEVKIQSQQTGKAEIYVESESVIILIFALDKAMRKFKYYKHQGRYEVKEIQKIESKPSKWDQEPTERLKEAITIYEGISY